MPNNLIVPDNITILTLPPKSRELNPVKNLWRIMSVGRRERANGF